jgi:preprotein translocase subunit SecF
MNIIGKRKIWFGISITLVLISILCTAFMGLNFGIDFTGGSLSELTIASQPTVDDLRNTISQAGFDSVRVQPSGEANYIVRLSVLSETQHQELLLRLGEQYSEVEEMRFDMVGPVIGSEMRTKAIWAIVAALALILAYIAWAFRKVSKPIASWKYGLLTIVAAMHDLIIPIGVFAVLGYFLGYQIDTAFVAALLTILGYSINDSIVVFDRTRENLTQAESESFSSIVNKSVNQTLTRSVNTSVTTLLVLLAVFFFGGDTVRHFALALIVGVISGTYSSIFLASPLLVAWEKMKK